MNYTEESSLVLNAAASWKDRCLLKGGSMFSDLPLWTLENFEGLRQDLVDKPDFGKRSFDDKLKEQLSSATEGVQCLCAEVRWLYYLIASNVNRSTKLESVLVAWNLSEQIPPRDHWALGEVLEKGPVNVGQGYLTHVWREFSFIVVSMCEWTRFPFEKRTTLLDDPWKFTSWLESQPEGKIRAFRHALLYLLFPNVFIDCVSHRYKRSIVKKFCNEEMKPTEVDKMEILDIDRKIVSISDKLCKQHSLQRINYFDEFFKKQWLTDENVQPRITNDEAWFRNRFGDSAVRIVAPGANANYWTDFVQAGEVRISYDSRIGDLRNYEKREDVHNKLIEYGQGRNPVHQSLALWQFLHDVEVGDFLVAKQGMRKLVGWGQVTGDYFFDVDSTKLPHVRTATWHALDKPITIRKEQQLNTKTLTRADGPRWLNWLKFAFDLMEGDHPPSAYRGYDVNQALEGLFLDADKYERVLATFTDRKNLIIQGPPGVGKTFIARRLAWCLVRNRDPEYLDMVQFHQSYSYEDFVQGWRPTETGGFTLRDGVFLRFCQRANLNPDSPYVFIIDEINRGNLSRIFGELLMLIEADKRGRDHEIALTYDDPNNRFSVPPNVYVLGLMNTADRSLAMVDYALRRRFAFETLEPAFGTEQFREHLLSSKVVPVLTDRIVEAYTDLNEKICKDKDLGPGFQIGHSYFVSGGARDTTWYENILKTQIAPLLREYWFDRPEEAESAITALMM